MRYELKVNRKELIDGLNFLRKVAKPKESMKVLLSCEEGNFVVCVNGVSIDAEASGEFPGFVHISAAQAINLSRVLPPEDPLTIALDGDRLFIGSLSITCVWDDVEPNLIQLPINASLPTVLGLKLKYTEQEISQSGLSNLLSEAEEKQKLLILKAAKVLESLGVARGDVERLVDETVRKFNRA